MLFVIGVLLIGGLLYGMYLFRTALVGLSSNYLRIPILYLARSPWIAFLTGLALAVLVQNSLAALAILVAFVSARLLSFRQSLVFVLGVSVGASLDVLPMDYPVYVGPLALIGALLYYVRREEVRYVGYLLMGLAVILGALWGMEEVGFLFLQRMDVTVSSNFEFVLHSIIWILGLSYLLSKNRKQT